MSDDLKQLGFRYDGPDEDSPTTHWLEEIDAEGNGTEKYHSFEVPDAIPRAWWERLRAKIETEYFRDAAIWSESQAARIALCLKLLALMDRIEKEAEG